jgi:hypothetical protein
MAVTHLVCVVVGAPGPWHTAKALVEVSDTTPKNTGATLPYRYARNFVLRDIESLPTVSNTVPTTLDIAPSMIMGNLENF